MTRTYYASLFVSGNRTQPSSALPVVLDREDLHAPEAGEEEETDHSEAGRMLALSVRVAQRRAESFDLARSQVLIASLACEASDAPRWVGLDHPEPQGVPQPLRYWSSSRRGCRPAA